MGDRYDLRSTLIASQIPVEKCHTIIGAPSRAGAILDRLVHNAHKTALKGDSLRKKRKRLQEGWTLSVAALREGRRLPGFPHSHNNGLTQNSCFEAPSLRTVSSRGLSARAHRFAARERPD